MFTADIDADGLFNLGGENFRVDMTAGHLRKPSDARAFTIVKNKPYLDRYAQIAEKFHPKSILELGIFQGGSFVLLDKMFRPERMAAALVSHDWSAIALSGVRSRYGSNQSTLTSPRSSHASRTNVVSPSSFSTMTTQSAV